MSFSRRPPDDNPWAAPSPSTTPPDATRCPNCGAAWYHDASQCGVCGAEQTRPWVTTNPRYHYATGTSALHPT